MQPTGRHTLAFLLNNILAGTTGAKLLALYLQENMIQPQPQHGTELELWDSTDLLTKSITSPLSANMLYFMYLAGYKVKLMAQVLSDSLILDTLGERCRETLSLMKEVTCLRDLCRVTVRKEMRKHDGHQLSRLVKRLPLPDIIQDYICMSEITDVIHEITKAA